MGDEYRVEYKINGSWEPSLTHQNLEYAEVAMAVLIQGGKRRCRIRQGGKTIEVSK